MATRRSTTVWSACILRFLHPLKVAIIEAFLWIEQPLPARFIDEMLDEEFGVSLVSYHMRSLARAGIIEEDHQRPVRGALQTFYRLGDRDG